MCTTMAAGLAGLHAGSYTYRADTSTKAAGAAGTAAAAAAGGRAGFAAARVANYVEGVNNAHADVLYREGPMFCNRKD